MKFRCCSLLGAFLLLASLPAAFAQSITNIFPQFGTNGDQITITGTGFDGTSKIFFWNGSSSSVMASIFVNTPNEITANVPAGISTGPIAVQNGAGPKNPSLQTFTVVSAAPFITDISPTFGSRGDPNILINGVHFLTATAVRFSGTNAPGFTPTTDGRQINTTVPVNAKVGTNFISVTSPSGSFTSQIPFTVFSPGAVVTNVDPYFGPAGTSIKIEGVHFILGTGNVTNVLFNGKPGTGFILNSENQLHINVPNGITTGPLTILSASGTNFNFTTSSNFYGPPVINSFSPASGRTGTNLVIIGTNFLSASRVEFGGTGGAFSIGVDINPPNTNSGMIQVTVPTNVITNPFRVITSGGAIATSSNFVVLPTITGFSPQFGRPNTNVIVTGANFTAAGLNVKFGGLNAAFVSGVTFGQLTAVVPNNATNAPIIITTVDGSVTSADIFYLQPILTSFTPTNAPPNSIVTITGQNLLGTTNVSFNGQLVSPQQPVNNTSVQVIVPDGVSTGPLSVLTPGGSATGASLFYGPPMIINFTPTHGLPGTNVTITGSNFLGATAVSFNGAPASFTPPSNNTNLQVRVPTNNVFNGPIIVVAPAGAVTSSIPFQLDFTNNLGVSIVAVPNPVFVGNDLTYTILVTNSGPFSAPNVVLSNSLPPIPGAVILKSASTTSGTLNTNSNPVTVTFSSLGASGSAAVTLVVIPQVPGTITDNAVVTGPYTDPVPGNDSASLMVTVLPTPQVSIQFYTPTLVQVSWPSALTNFALQFNGSLTSSGGWSNVSAPTFIIDDMKFIIDPIGATPKYYRLKGP
jgi:Domain of unknown function DUF11/IPT/TIG domain